jgi:hypothetical protein
MPTLESLLARLVQRQVEFVIVGGYAAATHGVSFVTQDVDICCPFTAVNLGRLREALADLHPFHRLTPARLPLEITPENVGRLENLYLMTDWGQLDCLSRIKGVGDFAAVKAAGIPLQLASGPCLVLGIDALIEAKLALGENRDKLTVIQLQAIRERLRSSRHRG